MDNKLKQNILWLFIGIFFIGCCLLFIRNCGQEGQITRGNNIIKQLTEENDKLNETNRGLRIANQDLDSANKRLEYAIGRESEINARQAELIERLQHLGEDLQGIGDSLSGTGRGVYEDIEAAKKLIQEVLDN